MRYAPSDNPLARWWHNAAPLHWWRQITTGRAGLHALRQRPHREADTVQAWPPEATRVLPRPERMAHTALVAALPECWIWPHVPLPHLVRVPSRRSYAEWIARIGHLSVDFAVCDRSSLLLGVVLMPLTSDSSRALRRRTRLVRVLEAAGVRVVEWHASRLDSVSAVRAALLPPAQPPVLVEPVSSAAPAQTRAH